MLFSTFNAAAILSLFLTVIIGGASASTAGGIMPITKINGNAIGSGVPGKITRQLHKTYWYKHSDPDWSLSVDDILNK